MPPQMGGWLLLLAVLLTGSMMGSAATLPWALVPLVFSVAAIAVSVKILRQLKIAGVKGFIRTWTVILLVFSAMSAFLTVTAMAFRPIIGPYQDCMQNAVTLTGLNECQADYQKMLEKMAGAK